MNKLLAEAIEAHGGLDNWKQSISIETDITSAGILFELKGASSRTAPFHYEARIHEQAVTMTDVTQPGIRMQFRPDRVAVETAEGMLVAERHNPRSSFAGHSLETPWNPLDRVYFGSYATWMYLTMPFSLSAAGAEVWDIDPIEEEGEVWRGIRAVMPQRFTTHSRAQEFYFGDDGLLRRQDYSLDVAEGVRVANYALDIIDVDGLKLPSKRRAFICNKRYEPLRDRSMVRLDFSNLKVNRARSETAAAA